MIYTKEFLISAYLSRFIYANRFSADEIESLEKLAEACYDKHGKEKFRKYASLDADALKLYKATV